MTYPERSWLPTSFRVRANKRLTSDTCLIDLEANDVLAMPKPGQFYMISAYGRGEIPVSVSHIDERYGRWSHTIRAVGAASQALCELRAADSIGVRGPYGNCWPQLSRSKEALLVFAGGIGLAPLRPVIEQHIASTPARPLQIYYGCRSPQDVLFQDDLDRWAQFESLSVQVTVDHADQTWHGDVGLITNYLEASVQMPRASQALLCGPEIMMRLTGSRLLEIGLQASDIYLSMERNMQCGIGVCGHCQWGRHMICKDGPIYALGVIQEDLIEKEL